MPMSYYMRPATQGARRDGSQRAAVSDAPFLMFDPTNEVQVATLTLAPGGRQAPREKPAGWVTAGYGRRSQRPCAARCRRTVSMFDPSTR